MRTNTLPRLAKTLEGIMNGTDLVAATICNRSTPLSATSISNIMSLLEIGYPGRRPRKLVDRKGNPRPTDMDLASFLVILTKKPTLLELPAYTALLPREVFESERHLSDRRYGNLIGLSSHREHLSFGVTIQDMSIVKRSPLEEDILGAPRTFLIMGYDANWHQGWQGISWQFRKDELGFREHYDLMRDNAHQGYQYFVHPNRRHSIFSRAHLLLKLLWQRIDEELRHYGYQAEAKASTGCGQVSTGPCRSIMVPTFTMKLHGLLLVGDYPKRTAGDELANHLSQLAYSQKQVQFLVRANELAFYQYGRTKDYVASWVKGGVWQHSQPTNQYCDEATLWFTDRVYLEYQTDTVSKKVAA